MFSSETDNFFLPLALRNDNTFLPFAVAILSLNPCLFLRLLFDGWYVLFIRCFMLNNITPFWGCKNTFFFKTNNEYEKKNFFYIFFG